ncbi:MAG: phosphoribosylformylglycinamidine synthase subunit PurQ [Synechococcales cyanobacterium]
MIGIVVFPGSNCDRDVAYITRHRLGCATRLIWHEDHELGDVDAVVIPGGFSYGDYLRCGALARFAPIMPAVQRFAQRGGLVLGICNGFQVLLEAGLLPGSLMRNRQLQFICAPVSVRVERTDLPWTQGYDPGQVLTLPIAHGEGCYVCDADTLATLEQQRQIVFRYVPEAENGSVASIAGICNAAGNVLGLMPHPERAADPELAGSLMDGWRLWQNLSQLTGASMERRRQAG